MPWWGWLGVIAAIIGISWAVDTWLLPKPIIRPLILRLFGKGEKTYKETPQSGGSNGISLQIPPPPPGMTHAEIKLTIDYVDGLPKAPPKIRDLFNEGQKLEKEYKYLEAIKQYEACFQAETTASQRVALHILIGNCFFSLSELEEAEGHYRQAETAAKEAKDGEGLAAALGNIGLIYQIKGELDKALDYHQQALKTHSEIGYREGEANALGNIGIIYQTKGDLDKALVYHQQALKINREIGRKEGEASQLGNIGIIYRKKGDLDKAREIFDQVLKTEREIGRRWGEANALGNIGNIYGTKGELDEALDYHQQALKIDREIGRKEGEASQLGNIGIVYHDKGESDKALEHLRQALKIFEEIGAKTEIEIVKRNIKETVESMESSRGGKIDTV